MKRAGYTHRIKKRKKRKGIHSKNNKPIKKYRGQGRWMNKFLDSAVDVLERHLLQREDVIFVKEHLYCQDHKMNYT